MQERYADGGIRGDWGANGSAYLVTPDDVGSVTAELVEDGPDLLVHDSMPPEPGDGAIAFVYGIVVEGTGQMPSNRPGTSTPTSSGTQARQRFRADATTQ